MAKLNAQELADAVADFVNGADKEDRDAFVEQIVYRTHRTLQQNVMKLIVPLIEKWAGLKESEYDLRNEATVKLARKLISTTDKYDRALPLI